jgi:hypothetical protein
VKCHYLAVPNAARLYLAATTDVSKYAIPMTVYHAIKCPDPNVIVEEKAEYWGVAKVKRLSVRTEHKHGREDSPVTLYVKGEPVHQQFSEVLLTHRIKDVSMRKT